MTKEDVINKPDHYLMWGWIEPVEFITSNKLSYEQWNIIKYVFRFKFKNWLEDLLKCRFYLDRLIENEKKIQKDI